MRAERGADILTRTRCTAARRDGDRWVATLEDVADRRDAARSRARALVNAAGPWVADVHRRRARRQAPARRCAWSRAATSSCRSCSRATRPTSCRTPTGASSSPFPMSGDFTLIGTTDMPYRRRSGEGARSSPTRPTISATSINRYLQAQITPADVVWTYSGVRPLYDDEAANASAVTRDYVLELDERDGQAPLLSIFGGKITTYPQARRACAGEAASRFFRQMRPAWTASGAAARRRHAGCGFRRLPRRSMRARLALAAGRPRRGAWRAPMARACERILGNAGALADLGRDFGDGLYEREVDYLVDQEWAMTAEDVLWRRSKLGLHVAPETARAAPGCMVRRSRARQPMPRALRPACRMTPGRQNTPISGTTPGIGRAGLRRPVAGPAA